MAPDGSSSRVRLAAIRTNAAPRRAHLAYARGWRALEHLATLFDIGEVYYDSLSVLVFLLLVGRFIQHRQRREAADAVELLYSVTPGSARRIENGQPSNVPVESQGWRRGGECGQVSRCPPTEA